MAKMKGHELSALLSRQIASANTSASDIGAKRGDLFDRYMAEPYGDEVADRSSVVSTDIADTVEWIMPELMEIFTAGDRVVDFEPLGPDDEERADQEADVVNHVFTRKNDGFLTLYSWFKDALVQKNGYVKRWWDQREVKRVEEYDGLTGDDLAQMAAQWEQEGAEVEILEQDSGEPQFQMDPATGQMIPLPPQDIHIKVRLTTTEEGLKVEPVPPEEILVSPRWRSIVLDDAPFVAHRRAMPRSDLIEMGYDRKQVNALPAGDDDEMVEEKVDRWSTQGSTEHDDEPADDSMAEVIVYECYIRLDYDGDGVAERRKITVAGSKHEVLKWEAGGEDNEEVETVPFSALTPVIVPHRHYGRSYAELVEDLQRIKTVLMRQMLDNVYLTNNPTREIAEDGIGENTIADLLVERPGKIVRTAQPGMYAEHTPPQFMHQMLPAIEYVDQVRETRTGVTKHAQGLDPNMLRTTATNANIMVTAAQKKIALIARIFSETGVKHLFRGIHADLRRNASRAMTVRLRGQYIEVDPRHWRHRADMAVNVALGTGNKDQMVMRLLQIAEKQEQHILNGSPLVTVAELHHTYSQIIEKSGFKNPDAFFRDPAQIPPQPEQPPQPDPQMMLVEVEREKAQAKAQIDQMKAQTDAQEAAAKMRLEMQRAAMEDDRERDRLNIDAALRLVEINAKNQTAVTMEQIRAQAKAASAANKPGPNA